MKPRAVAASLASTGRLGALQQARLLVAHAHEDVPGGPRLLDLAVALDGVRHDPRAVAPPAVRRRAAKEAAKAKVYAEARRGSATLGLTHSVDGSCAWSMARPRSSEFDPRTRCVYPGRVNRVVSGAQDAALIGGSSLQVLDSTSSHLQSASITV